MTAAQLIAEGQNLLSKVRVKPKDPESTSDLTAAKAKFREGHAAAESEAASAASMAAELQTVKQDLATAQVQVKELEAQLAALDPPPPPPPPPAEKPIYVGAKIADFEPYANQSAPGAWQEVDAPDGSGAKVLSVTVKEADVAPITPTPNPRGQLLTPNIWTPGITLCIATAFWLPEDFPIVTNLEKAVEGSANGWVSLFEGPYGKPFDGSGPDGGMVLEPGETAGTDVFRNQRNGDYDWDIPWQAPAVRGKKIEVMERITYSGGAEFSEGEGSFELWVDREQITFFEQDWHNPLKVSPTTRLVMKTRDSAQGEGADDSVIQQYRKIGMANFVAAGSATVYFWPVLVGPTPASVGY